jgi:1-acyl-sn-glycerol-3-phosphate acyltransferase
VHLPSPSLRSQRVRTATVELPGLIAPPPVARPERAIPVGLVRTSTPERVKRAACASWWRAKLWGLILSVATDGVATIPSPDVAVPLSRKTPLPDGPLIILVNNPSRIDVFVLAATIGRARPMRFVAPADYWLESRVYLWAARIFAGVWLARRRTDLLAAAPTVRAGVAMVNFARADAASLDAASLDTASLDAASHDAPVFDAAVFELAAQAGARVLPVAIVGTADVLPADARRSTRHPIEVRWGTPFGVDGSENADDLSTRVNAEITELAAVPAVARAGAGWTRIRRVAFGWTGLAIVAFWAFSEGMFWPLLAEMPLLLLVVTVGRSWRGPLLIGVSALASACGILATWFLVSHGINTPEPLTTARMHAVALAQISADPATAFWDQMWNGIPVKVYAHATGDLGLSFVQVLSVMLPRLLRIGIVGGAGWLLGGTLSRFLKPCLGAVQIFCLAVFPFGLALVIYWWS